MKVYLKQQELLLDECYIKEAGNRMTVLDSPLRVGIRRK